jgi:hypothetical protein
MAVLLIVIIILLLIAILVTAAVLDIRLQRETAKKQALQWILSGKIPSPAAYNKVHENLAKHPYDEEFADIVAKLTMLKEKTK